MLARDDETGRIGTFQASFVIPNLNKETKRVPISSVVLSSERSPMSDAIYNASKGKEQAKEIAADPLIQNGAKMIPSVTRVFSKSRNMFVYLQAYEAPILAATPVAGSAVVAPVAAPTSTSAQTRPLIAFVSFYQGQNKVYETHPTEVSPLPNTRLQIAPMNFTVDLSTLAPGKYDCQVSVLDPSGGKGAFWKAQIMVVP